MKLNCGSKSPGFTLSELLIVVVVVSILSAIALPSYLEQTRKGKRAEGKAKLAEVVQKLERSYTDNSTYTTSLGPLYGLAAGASIYSGNNNDATTSAYVITAAATAGSTIASSFTLSATPNGTFSDDKCNVLTLTNTGVKGVVGGTGSVADCW
jgi:type IV pilus assembly protein PilE